MATAIVQLFFLASAIAAAATFFAVSRLIDAPYGFGICARVLEAPSASATPSKDLARDLGDMIPPLSRFLRAGRFCHGPRQRRFFSTLWPPRHLASGRSICRPRESLSFDPEGLTVERAARHARPTSAATRSASRWPGREAF